MGINNNKVYPCLNIEWKITKILNWNENSKHVLSTSKMVILYRTALMQLYANVQYKYRFSIIIPR